MPIPDPLRVPIEVLPHGEGLDLPVYETSGAAGMDLQAAVGEALVLEPGGRDAVPTGLCMAIPSGYEAQIRPRSGWALKAGVTCLNAPGTIDSDYRGEVKIILANLGAEPVRIERGMKIAQIVFAPVTQVAWDPAGVLDATARGAGGFGHTGR